jgi:hypothetical protein
LSIDVEDESEIKCRRVFCQNTPKNKAKVMNIEDDALVTTPKNEFRTMAGALAKSGGDNDAIPRMTCLMLWWPFRIFMRDIYLTTMINLLTIQKIANPFMMFSLANKLVWVSSYVDKTFGVLYNLN